MEVYNTLAKSDFHIHNARMTSVPARPSQPLPRLFLTPVDSDWHDFLREVHRLASAYA